MNKSVSPSLLTQWLQQNRIRAVDHALGSSLQRLDAQTSDVVAACVAATSYAHSLGHTCLSIDQLQALWLRPDATNADSSTDAEVYTALLNSSWRARDAGSGVFVLDENAIALQRYWHYEKAIADAIVKKTLPPPIKMQAALEDYWQQLFPQNADAKQALAAKRSYENRFLLLSGGPGTGKTSVLGKLLAMLCFQAALDQKPMPRIALAAPTGKAAMRMSEALRACVQQMQHDGVLSDAQYQALMLRASTLHRLLGYQPNSVQFEHHQHHQLPIDLLVIDEASMIDVPLLHKTLQALPDEAKLILIGDVAQLPSVEIGQAFRDIHAVFSDTDALMSHHVNLERVYRQHKASGIAQAANSVRDGDSASFIVYCRRASSDDGIQWHDEQRPMETILREQALPYFENVLQASSIESAFAISKKFRILCASRDDHFGVLAVNRFLVNALKPKSSARFFKGQCLMITANQPRESLFNGDLGLCWPDAEGALRVWFETTDGLQSFHPLALPAHEDAYAITIHKAQGSEFDDILLILPDAEHRVLTRELLYTGLTRAKQHVYVCASTQALETAIHAPTLRWTNLVRMIKNSSVAQL
jgi:exodeoxyribonuclease V alpha subunit